MIGGTPIAVSTHSRLKAAGCDECDSRVLYYVSTHSRLKAAGHQPVDIICPKHGFNTQPPKGGWIQAQ